MTLTLLKGKLHRIRVTEACLDYEGSLSLNPDDMEAVGIVPWHDPGVPLAFPVESASS